MEEVGCSEKRARWEDLYLTFGNAVGVEPQIVTCRPSYFRLPHVQPSGSVRLGIALVEVFKVLMRTENAIKTVDTSNHQHLM